MQDALFQVELIAGTGRVENVSGYYVCFLPQGLKTFLLRPDQEMINIFSKTTECPGLLFFPTHPLNPYEKAMSPIQISESPTLSGLCFYFYLKYVYLIKH